MTLPQLGSLLLSFALVPPRLLAESDDRESDHRVGAFLADARPGTPAPEVSSPKSETSVSSPKANATLQTSTLSADAASAPPKPKAPPPFLVLNRSASDGVQPGGSDTRPTTTTNPGNTTSRPSRLRVTPPNSVVSGALRESFHYDARLHAQAVKTGSDDDALSDTDSDVVMLPKMAVNERPLPRELGADIARWHSQAPQNHTRLGTGIHQKDFGKVRVSVPTLLYIPIGIGVSW